MKYDEQFLLKAADRLEQKAREIIFMITVKFGLVAFGASLLGAEALSYFAGRKAGVPVGAIVFIATGVAIIGGILEGRSRAFDLRVQVNQLLALTEIERNTRKAAPDH